MKHRSWIKVIAALSPRTAFRKANSNPASLVATDAGASSAPPIPLSMLATITRVVQYTDENHLEEEGLYRKPGVGLERKELLRLCRCNQLPDLSVYNPHSIATVVKEILGELYEPLIPADISQQLLEAVSAGQMNEKAENDVMEIFKQIPFSTREFLQVFLNHLHTVAASGSSHMSVANLALNVGIALVQPPEDKTTSNSKITMRRRKCIAEFLIRQAPLLPYDCATEMNIPAIPEEKISTPMIDPANTASTKQINFVQVTWDVGESEFTVEQLEQMFSAFGQIESIGINDLGNRAIVAYADAAGAEAAEHASTPTVRIRRRKPRQGEKRREYSPRNSMPRRTLNDEGTGVSTDATKPITSETASTRDLSEPESKDEFQLRSKLEMNDAANLQNTNESSIDDTIVVEDIEDDQFDGIPHTNTNDHSEVQEDRSPTNQEAEESDQSDKLANIHQSIQSSVLEGSSVQGAPESEQTSGTVEIETELEANEAGLSTGIEHQDDINDSKHETPSPEASPLYQDLYLANADENDEPFAENSDIAARTALPIPEVEDEHESNGTTAKMLGATQNNQNLVSEAAEMATHTSQLEATNVSTSGQDDCNPTAILAKSGASIEELQSRLLDMEKILSTSTSALSSTKLANEFERAVLQLHKQILDMVYECLILAGLRRGEVSDKSMGTTNAEFLDFLEAQSKTQVKILEVEVRAGQELLRLHKAQYEKEHVELDEEITALRVGRTEAERLCSELRADLRKCRSELACHVANATDIQRQKGVLEEKLASCEDKLHAKEVALVKLQVEYDNMHRVAADAQMRVEKLKQSDNQAGHNVPLPESKKKCTSTCGNEDLPYTSKLFSKLSQKSNDNKVVEEPGSQAEAKLEISPNSERSSNVAALEAMKQQMARDIQEQITITRAALKEMEICSTSGKTLQEEEEELRHLQQQLAARSAEMDIAMNESRSKLKELVDPSAASSFRDDRAAFDEMESNQESTIFDSTALVNELIARAEKTPVAKSRQYQYGEEFSSDLDIQRPFASIDSQQLALRHRPAQSVLYKRWTADRSRKMAQLASYRDQQAVLQAQQSIQIFQQALTEVRGKW